MALLVLANGGYVPAACWTSAGGLRTGDECLDLVPVRTDVQLVNGDRVHVLGEAPIHHCDSEPDDPPARRGLRLATRDRRTIDVGIAVWPEISAVDYRRVTPQQLTDTTTVEQAVRRVAPAVSGEPRIQMWTGLDVDGDGDDETFYSVVVPGTAADDPALAFSGFFIDETDGGELRLLFRSEYEVTTVSAVLDIDGDGAHELILSRRYYEGDRVELVTVAQDGLEIIGGWACGA